MKMGVYIKIFESQILHCPGLTALVYGSDSIQELIKPNKLSSFHTGTQMRIQFINFSIVLPVRGYHSSWILSYKMWILLEW